MNTILLISSREWHSLSIQRANYLTASLRNRYRIIFVNPIYYSSIGFIRDTLAGRRNRTSLLKTVQIDHDLYVLDPAPLFPRGQHFPKIGQLNYRINLPYLQFQFKKNSVGKKILWLTQPPDRILIGRSDEDLVIYDCMDNHPAFYQGAARRRMAHMENQMLKECDVVFTSSEGLKEKCLQHNNHVHMIRNGVDNEFFVNPDHAVRIETIQNGLVAGYIGTIDRWFDQELLARAAEKYPQVRFVLVGSVNCPVDKLHALPNIHFIGERPYKEVPQWIESFDVCLIPFIINDLTVDVNPLKMYEYFALGKPVLSTAIPEVRRYSEFCYIGEDQDDCIRLLDEAIKESIQPKEELINARKRVAAENTWESRAEEIHHIIQSSLEN